MLLLTKAHSLQQASLHVLYSSNGFSQTHTVTYL